MHSYVTFFVPGMFLRQTPRGKSRTTMVTSRTFYVNVKLLQMLPPLLSSHEHQATVHCYVHSPQERGQTSRTAWPLNSGP